MHRRSFVAAAAGVLALGVTSACSSPVNQNGASTSGGNPASPGPSSGTSDTATTSASAAPVKTVGDSSVHGGVTLIEGPPMPTTQGTKPITLENNPIPSLEQNFNAFDPNGFGYKLNIEGLFYEPMLMFNTLKANTAYPWLATDFAWNSDGTQLTFTVRDGVKFSDGSPLTPADVAYTYQVQKDNPATNRNGLPIESAKVTGSTVVITFSAAQFQNLYSIAGQTFIVKEAAYKAAGDASKFPDKNPVGTGPYKLGKFSPQGLVFTANDSYWGGKPPVPEVDVPSFSSADVALQQLVSGNIDYCGNFIPRIETTFVSKDPQHHKYWFPAINVVNLVFNVKTGPKALRDPKVRQAISAAIDRTKVSVQAEQGYEPPATSSSGILLPNFESLVPADYKNDLKASTDPATVDTLMKGAGYAKNGQGFWAKGGEAVAFSIEDPTVYTDYYQAAQIMADDFKKLGFNASVKGVDANKWYADLAAGTFDTSIHWSNTGPSPYSTFQGWMDPSIATGSNASGNYGRFSDPTATKALASYAKAGTAEEAQTAIDALSKVMKEQVPVAPIMYAAGWYEYNTTNYGGWVTEQNQYMDPSPNPANCAYVVLHLTPNA